MKRIALLLLLPVMLMGLAACGGDDDDDPADTNDGDTTNGETATPAEGSDTGGDDGDESGDDGDGSSGQGEAANPTPDPSLFDMEAAETTDTGLMIIEEAEGDGDVAEATDTVVVHYTGMLTDGTEFDSSRSRGEPSEFALSGVIAGFAEGIVGMAEGGQRTLYIPSDLGYGEQGQGPIPPGADLIFEVELIEVIQ